MTKLNKEYLSKNVKEASNYKDDALENSAFLQMALATKFLGGKYLSDKQAENVLKLHLK